MLAEIFRRSNLVAAVHHFTIIINSSLYQSISFVLSMIDTIIASVMSNHQYIDSVMSNHRVDVIEGVSRAHSSPIDLPTLRDVNLWTL